MLTKRFINSRTSNIHESMLLIELSIANAIEKFTSVNETNHVSLFLI